MPVSALATALHGSMVNGLSLVYTPVIFCAYRVGVCYGQFPDFLLEAWDDFDFRKKSDNDRPSEKMEAAGA